MNAVRVVAVLTLLGLATIGITSGGQTPRDRREDAYRANNIGVALLEQYQYDEAVSSFRRALELEPALHIAQLNLAIALFYAGQTDAALSAATAAADLLPALPHPRYVIGLATRPFARAARPITYRGCGREGSRSAAAVAALRAASVCPA